MTKSERLLLAETAERGCALCRWLGYGKSPAQIHHVRTGTGIGRRAPHSEVIPLCMMHHTGPEGIHGMGRRAWEKKHRITELELLAWDKGETT